jgi:GDP-L-fucose synthase
LDQNQNVLVTGASGLVGSALISKLSSAGFQHVVGLSSRDLDLMDLSKVVSTFKELKPDLVFHMAGAVYGIAGNLHNPARSFLNNILINTHVVEASRQAGAKKIVGMGSICAYPFPPPIKGPLIEDYVFQGKPHPGEEFYGHAKRALYAQLEAYRRTYGIDYAFVLSTNLYGPHDKFDVEHGHVVPSLIRKFFLAQTEGRPVRVWGDGEPTRDFMYSEDAAEALIAIMHKHTGAINLATGNMHRIRDVVDALSSYTGTAELVSYDSTMPKGHEFESFDTSRLRALGYQSKTSLKDGLIQTFEWYKSNWKNARH